MAGLDRVTGRPLDGFAHVVQSIDVIFTTRLGDRVMRRWFGAIGSALLGRLLVPKTILLFITTLATALDLWEPRFKVARIDTSGNTADAIRLGQLALVIEGEYRPRGHLGDTRSEGLRRISLASSKYGYTLSEV
ncbi:GPW/gp25 family protein [Rhodomicrobium lacus]|uniref:GPW/gp25 family protein n=1 Tax=Rhodomicrobium lacus TaxID=2498452 RepID=UPI000F8F2BDD|nr:GPW/gp25 family protein [Rhodomicrobium lacus]